MKKMILFVGTVLCSLALQAQVLAFPEAEGFGRYASGGRGGKVVTVTSLDDYTKEEAPIEGTLRWALEQHITKQTIDRVYTATDGSDSIVPKEVTMYEPLTIVFNVAGNIVLKETLKVKRPNLTIAGQSAPGQGVCITGRDMLFNGATGGDMWYYGPRHKNLIVRYLRFRPSTPTAENKYVTYGTDVENYEDVILDHCTMTWANEECLAFYDTKNTTVQWCLIAEGLYKANHPKGNRSYCGVWGGQFATYHHNLIAHNDSRNIRFNGARAHDTVAVVDYRHNVVYNWGTNNSGYGLEVEVKVPNVTRNELNMVNNYYKHGPASGWKQGKTPSPTDKVNRLVRIDQSEKVWNEGYESKHYIIGNYLTNYPEVTSDNWFCGVQFNISDTAKAKQMYRAEAYSPEVLAAQPLVNETAEQAYERVLNGVGAIVPQRDWQDSRIVEETRTGTAVGKGSKNKLGIIDDPVAVGGWPILQGEPYVDTDADGMPDEWEKANALNPNNPDDGALITESGYSNLEVYLNSIVPLPPSTDLQNISQDTAKDVTYYLENGVIYLLRKGEKYTLQGVRVK